MNKNNALTKRTFEPLAVRVRCEFTRNNASPGPRVAYGHQLRSLETLLRANFGESGARVMRDWALASSEGRSNG